MKNEQNLDFGVHLASLAADDAIVATTGSVATYNTGLTTAMWVDLNTYCKVVWVEHFVQIGFLFCYT